MFIYPPQTKLGWETTLLIIGTADPLAFTLAPTSVFRCPTRHHLGDICEKLRCFDTRKPNRRRDQLVQVNLFQTQLRKNS